MREKGSQGDCVPAQGRALSVVTSEAARCREIDFTNLVQPHHYTNKWAKQQVQSNYYIVATPELLQYSTQIPQFSTKIVRPRKK